jgi:hypothetical protein
MENENNVSLEIEELSKEDRVKKQNRLRQKKYYEANKDKVKALRKEKYESKPDGEQSNSKYSNDLLKQRLTDMELNPNTKRKYLYDLNRLLELCSQEPLLPLIRDGNAIISKVSESTFAVNTKRGIIQIALFMITKFELNVNKKARDMLTKYFELLKEINTKEHDEKQETETVLSWAEYLNRIKTEYGESSKMYLIARLYNEITLRDDYILKILLKSPKGDVGENYLVLNKNNYTMIISKYKTESKYGVIKVKLTKGLTYLIGEYMKNNNLKENDYLFGDHELTAYVVRMNKKINVNGGISYYRKMTVSELLNNKQNVSDEERISLAKKMAHSPYIQLKYLRKMED